MTDKELEKKGEELQQAFVEFSQQGINNGGKPSYNVNQKYMEPYDNRFGGFLRWGKDNLYPNMILELEDSSPIHQAILDLKSSMIGGNGFSKLDWDERTTQFMYNNGDKMDKILDKITKDFVRFDGCAVFVTWNKGKKGISDITYLSPLNIRIAYNKKDIQEGKYVESYLVSSDWKNANNPECTPVPYPKYDINNKEDVQIYFFRNHRVDGGWYPKPNYTAGIKCIDTDAKINSFHLSTIDKQFAPGCVVTFPFAPKSKEEKRNIVESTTKDFKGALAAGNPFILFGADKDKLPTITPYNTSDADKKYGDLKKSVVENIAIAHKLTDQTLLAIQQPVGLGQRTSLLESLSIFQSTYVAGYQKILQDLIMELARECDVVQEISIEKYSTNLTPDLPISDLVTLLSSTLTEKQQAEILENKGYTREQALRLVNKGSNITAPVTQPVTTVK